MRLPISAPRAALISILLGLVAAPGVALAVSPTLWTLETFDEFEKGKPDGAAVAAGGELVLAPSLKPLKVPALDDSSEPFLWSQAVDGRGTLYVGGGNGGRVYRVPRGGQGSVYFETGDLAVHALAVDRSDVLYAATSPQGKIYRISGEAKGEVYYQPEDRYTWALVFSPKGELYAATGERGIVYRITAKGKAEIFFDSEEFHVVSLAVDPSGALLAGTDGKGLLYRISAPGKAVVLHDSRLREINAVAVDAKGTIYAAAIGIEGGPPLPPLPHPQAGAVVRAGETAAPPVAPLPIPGIDAGAATTVTVVATAAAPPPLTTPPRSEVYRIDPDGTVSTIWSSQDEVVYSLLIDATGRPIIGSGDPGRIRALAGSQRSTLMARLPESQVTALALGLGEQVFAASSNVGRVYLLDSTTSESGTYVSPARDTETMSRWGRISWRATVPSGGRVELSTRSGNSAAPDATWSEWSAPYGSPDGSAVSSPAARYIQWRARLARPAAGRSPALHAVSIAYVQANLSPALRKISILPPGVVRERLLFAPETDPADLAFSTIKVNPAGSSGASSGPLPDKKTYVRGMRALEWEAEDPNGDALSYDVLFRGEGETAFKPLARGVRESYFAFDSMQLPDGLYRVQVEASDAPSNTAAQARSASLLSDPFMVDNTPPSVQVATRKASRDFTLEVSASDTIGPIARADYSVDAARWLTLAPADGVSDSRSETYAVTLAGLRPGEHTVIVKVTDLLGNVGAAKATFHSD